MPAPLLPMLAGLLVQQILFFLGTLTLAFLVFMGVVIGLLDLGSTALVKLFV